MGYASRSGRARTSARNPRAFGVCDRCSLWYNHYELSWQYDWAGASLINKRILVCDICYDTPQNQLRAIIIPADPMPIVNARVEPYQWDEIDRRQLSGFNSVSPTTGIPIQQGNTRATTVPGDTVTTTSTSGNGTTATVTFSTSVVYPLGTAVTISGVAPAGYNGTFSVTASSAGSVSFLNSTTGAQTVAGTLIVDDATLDTRVTQQTGEAPYGKNQLPGTDSNAVTYRTVTAAVNNGSGLIRLTLPTTNGMITGQLVTVQEVGGVTAANGNWYITVVNSTQIDLKLSTFSGTYTSGGYVINNPSLPYGFTEVPRTGTL